MAGAEAQLVRRLDRAMHGATRAATLTKRLLAFSRQQPLSPMPIDVNNLLNGLAEFLRRALGEHVSLEVVGSGGLWPVEVDATELESALVNLAVNARDAMPQGGRLILEAANADLDDEFVRRHVGARPGPHVVLAVSDTGTGIPREIQPHIFEPFFTTKDQGKGTGLGLATVYGIVKQSGGYVQVNSEPGQGTTFLIYLPRLDDATVTVDRGARPVTAAAGSETILLVEDEEEVRELARDILRANGYTVLEARNGNEALLISERHQGPLDLLLTDVVMPRMSGRELAERLAPVRPVVSVLYMSGYTDDAVIQHGVYSSGTAFLQKPFTPAALIQRVRETLDLAPACHSA
jgi:CheY-like chemotaxis protein